MFKICQIKQDQSQDEGIIAFTLTKKVVDRDSEVVLPSGAMLDNYKINPVFLWAHDMKFPPIGKIIPESLIKTDDELSANVKFDLNDPFAKNIYSKYKNGFLNAGSIRFIPIDYSADPVLPGQKGMTYKTWELLEFSGVPVPSNPQALVKKDLDDDKDPWMKMLKDFLMDDNFDHTPDGWVQKMNKVAGDEPTEEWDNLKPYPNEHACRLKDPGQYQRFRRGNRKHEGKTYSIIWGIKSDGTVEEQAYRYPKDTWSEGDARKHCKDHNGISFEPAAKEKFHFDNLEDAIKWINKQLYLVPNSHSHQPDHNS